MMVVKLMLAWTGLYTFFLLLFMAVFGLETIPLIFSLWGAVILSSLITYFAEPVIRYGRGGIGQVKDRLKRKG